MKRLAPWIILSLLAFTTACGDDDAQPETPDAAPTTPDAAPVEPDAAPPEDLDMKAEDFTCILDWPKVERFRIINLLGHQEEAEAVARSAEGGTYPVGTVIQLIANEAMVKRRPGFNAETNDWEYFFLDTTADGTSIVARGGAEVVNAQGDKCQDCHAPAQEQFDMVCSSGHGCDPLPFTPEQIEMFQNMDPRCQPQQ